MVQVTFFPLRSEIHYATIAFSGVKTFLESHPVRIQTPVNFLQEDAEVTKAFEEDIETPPTRNIPSPGQLDPDTRIPVINLEDGTRLVGEDAPKNKDLVEWLKLHPTYTVDMPSYVPVSTREFSREESCEDSPHDSPVEHRHSWSFCLLPERLLISNLPQFLSLCFTLETPASSQKGNLIVSRRCPLCTSLLSSSTK